MNIHCRTLMILLAFASLCSAQTDEAEKERYRRWMDFYDKEIRSMRIHVDDDEKTELVIGEQPVLRWTNPTRANQIHGVVYLWTLDGRIAVMGSLWSHVTSTRSTQRTVGRQFHSLSDKPLVAYWRGEKFWYPRSAGIDPQPFQDAPAPAETRPARLSQMRALARGFHGDGEEFNTRRGIRLLTQPLHRQERGQDVVLDGALFTFAMGTDPEVIVLIEARETTDGPKWHYSVGRFSGMQTDLRYKNDVVWRYRGPAQQFDPKLPYLASYNVMVKPLDIGDSAE